MTKSRPGVCDVCGHAVLRALREPEEGEINGHSYKSGKLEHVRCRDHGGWGFLERPDYELVVDCFSGSLLQPTPFT